MEFLEFRNIVHAHISKIIENVDILFEVDVDKEEMWNVYLENFPEGTNPIFRERRKYDCSECKSFFRSFGNAVVIKDNKMYSIWDFEIDDPVFKPVVKALSEYIHAHKVKGVLTPRSRKMGVKENHEDTGKSVLTWHHLYYELPKRFGYYVNGTAANQHRSERNDARNVFKRSLEEFSYEAVMTVIELIKDNSLYRGEEWLHAILEIKNHMISYQKLNSDEEKELYTWEKSIGINVATGKIRNHSIGTLLVNLSEGMDLELAVKKYEAITAPENYKRPKPIYTKRMLEDAKKTVEELGYLDSLHRRFATLDDISVSNILFANRNIKSTNNEDLFDSMEKDITVSPKKYDRAEEISIEDFVKNVLPHASEIEVLFENRHAPNLMSLITSKDPGTKSMFKWNNSFSWAYSGNIADSSIKENVKSAGGNVNGVLRFSIQWNDETKLDSNDLDAHCIEPNGNEIYFSKPVNRRTHGNLDVDIIHPKLGIAAVENITWPSKDTMDSGLYQFFVNVYTYLGGQSGFRAEIEFDGEIHKFDYRKSLRTGENISVANVLFKEGRFEIINVLPDTVSVKEIWGLKTNRFVPVTCVMYSPNYWDEQTGIGNRHYFFMLKGAVNKEMPNGFFNEYLKNELVPHKRVFEALGSKAHVIDTPDQLSGIGFSSTKRNDLIVKVKRDTERIFKVKF